MFEISGSDAWSRRAVLAAALGGLAATNSARARALAITSPDPVAGVQHRPKLPLQLLERAPDGLDPRGYLVSEKYDGVRAQWDGQTLRFRSGRPIAAPRAFTAGLPDVALDGELWFDRARFDALSATVRRNRPKPDEWSQVRYMVFELPLATGTFAERAQEIAEVAAELASKRRDSPFRAVAQQRIETPAELHAHLAAVVAAGGEGLVLHRADAPVIDGRSDSLLKLKPHQDAEATVIAHLGGRGRLSGRLGALRVRSHEGVEFDLGSGLSDHLRSYPPHIGAVVTYAHDGFTPDGVPRFARLVRVREPE